jgi:DNA-binding transcriptional MerR regulator
MVAGSAASEQRLLRIGEIASETGTTLRTLHYYEELGLLEPARRTKGGFRLYQPAQVEEVRYIQRLRDLGLELAQIKDFLNAKRTDDQQRPAHHLRSTVERELRRTQSLLFRYSRLRDELDAILDILRECDDRHCPRTPGGASCPRCEVILDRDCVPSSFLQPIAARN